ncbi:flagellar basal body-associated FliL family protein [Undibacterium sp. RTI2.1]|uniref:flagellar basal body-associated FliL family protein n=1 Tax=unclassified Undibacterium TaxID=2630295 RepID=UPI002AB55655|nr:MULTISPECIES: flagellar basal body-associated FliL family protein [unclassified Undibacterium]MDY7536983.1 flagellar basal body-associated FliL family protein [Undibacterium sp. 5I1]MEB0033006.1 flagellar basal body-associated FliL family protein [Undibacterium sp. RTI2.1]MEB0118862.1 flagellar basal body-associated FliL family protein [Undibacterium sp. RTI2.2]MEB0231337.1 flagellar basal body-associated FliL family protein [Undibacterium sp. 10I3]MEB0258750.1 flagellar basal body-associat
MANSDAKKALLTSKLDFEPMHGGIIKSSEFGDNILDEWGFSPDSVVVDSKPAPDKVNKSTQPVPPANSPLQPSPSLVSSDATTKSKRSVASISLGESAARASATQKKVPLSPTRKTAVVRKKDQFTQYAASIILLGFIVISVAIYFYVNRAPKNNAEISYATLPEAVVNINGQVTRMQVTIQVGADDQGWLQENTKSLNDIFKVAISNTNPDDLRTPEGFLTLQNNLKQELNKAMNSDKVQAVLLTELLLQDKS